eukprot:jgi/Bigna1/79109/fgenesh1_pg.59_\
MGSFAGVTWVWGACFQDGSDSSGCMTHASADEEEEEEEEGGLVRGKGLQTRRPRSCGHYDGRRRSDIQITGSRRGCEPVSKTRRGGGQDAYSPASLRNEKESTVDYKSKKRRAARSKAGASADLDEEETPRKKRKTKNKNKNGEKRGNVMTIELSDDDGIDFKEALKKGSSCRNHAEKDGDGSSMWNSSLLGAIRRDGSERKEVISGAHQAVSESPASSKRVRRQTEWVDDGLGGRHTKEGFTGRHTNGDSLPIYKIDVLKKQNKPCAAVECGGYNAKMQLCKAAATTLKLLYSLCYVTYNAAFAYMRAIDLAANLAKNVSVSLTRSLCAITLRPRNVR